MNNGKCTWTRFKIIEFIKKPFDRIKVKFEKLDLLHVHYAIPHASAAYMAQQILKDQGVEIPFVTTLHGTDITLVGKDPSFEPVINFSINKSNRVTAVSENLKKETFELDIKNS